MYRIMDRVDDYHLMGVKNVWIIDPIKRRAWNMLEDGTQQVITGSFAVADSSIVVELREVWSRLDYMQSQD